MPPHKRSAQHRPDPRRAGGSDPPPYPPSAFDRLQAWIERLPIPTGAAYLFAAAAFAILIHIPRWLDGTLPPGAIEVNQLTAAIFPTYFYALTHYLNHAARRALANYRPLLDLSDRDYGSLETTLTTLPLRSTPFILGLGALLSALSFFPAPEAWGAQPSFSALSSGSLYLGALTLQIGATYWIFQAVHQARTIDRIHRTTARINLYRRDPVYAFSALTLRAALGTLFPAYAYMFLSLGLGLAAAPSAVDYLTIGFVISLSLAVFVLPLSRMQGRLAAEKRRLLLELDERYTLLVDRFNRQVDKGGFKDLDSTARAIAVLTTQRQAVERVSTWPWRPETFRSLASTIALPVVLYLLSRLLGRLVGV